MAVQQHSSLFEPQRGPDPIEGALAWFEGLLFGEAALALCVIAVALIGAVMLSGRLPLRGSARVILGCFVLLGAPLIASNFVAGTRETRSATDLPQPIAVQHKPAREELPPANYDPYSGASLGRE